MNEIADKIAIRFAKHGRSVYASHHDLMRVVARALRRVELPVRMTSGFNPRPRAVFPQALGLGIESDCEYVEVELVARVDTASVCQRLRDDLRGVLDILNVERLAATKKGRVVSWVRYWVQGIQYDAMDLADACEWLSNCSSHTVDRERGGNIDVAANVGDITVSDKGLEFTIRHGSEQVCKPEEVIRALSVRCTLDLSRIRYVKIGLGWKR